MTDNQKKIRDLTIDMLHKAFPKIVESIEKSVQCGALNTDDWDRNYNPMIIPKIILTAVLEEEANQYKADGTSFEKEMKKEVKNLKLFI